MRVEIIDIDHKGNGIARIDNKVLFVPKSIVGDVLEIDIVKKHKKYDDGRIREILKKDKSSSPKKSGKKKKQK